VHYIRGILTSVYTFGIVFVFAMKFRLGRWTLKLCTVCLKKVPPQPVSSKRNHQVADKSRKVCCLNSLNVYCRKRGRVGVKQCMHPSIFRMKLFLIFYLANVVCFYLSKYKAFLQNIHYIFLFLPYTKYTV
jgi:hypothetical protein